MHSTQPRRKLATYGKLSRKHVFSYSTDGDPIGQSPKAKKLTSTVDGNGDRRAGPVTPTSTRPGVLTGRSLSYSDDLTKPPRGQSSSPRLRTSPRNYNSTSAKALGQQIQLKLQPPPPRDDAVFDVPSSDDEQSAKKPSPRRPLNRLTHSGASFAHVIERNLNAEGKRKTAKADASVVSRTNLKQATLSRKRKADDSVRREPSPALVDDSLLQRHIAMQCALDGRGTERVSDVQLASPFKDLNAAKRERTTPKASSAPNLLRSPPQVIKTFSRLTQTVAPSQSPMKITHEKIALTPSVTPPPARASKVAPDTTLSPPSMAKEPQLKRELLSARRPPVSSARETSIKNIRRVVFPRQQTPPRVGVQKSTRLTPQGIRKIPSGTKSPRQTELWSQLLEPAAEANHAPSITAADGIDSCRSESGRARSSAKVAKNANELRGKTVYSMQQAVRRKLIDTLAPERTISADDDDIESADECDEASRSPSQARLYQPPDPPPLSESQDTNTSGGSQPSSQLLQVDSQVRALLEQGGSKVTYARERSFLTEASMDEAAMFSQPLDLGISDFGSQGRRRAVPTRPVMSKSDFDMDDDEEDPAGGTLKSIHELRHAGGNKRFQDESEALLEEIEIRDGHASVSRRRNVLLELVTKLVEKEFARRFVDQSLDRRVLIGLESEHDVLTCCALLSIFVTLASHGGVSPLVHHVSEHGIFVMATSLLDENQSVVAIAKDRRSNMSKVAQKSVIEYSLTTQKSGIWTTEEPRSITPRIIALCCLDVIVRHNREFGNPNNIISSSDANKLVQLLASSVADDVTPTVEVFDRDIELHFALSILESCTLKIDSNKDPLRAKLNVSGIHDYFAATSHRTRDDAFHDSRALALRLLLNVTNNNPAACDTCGQSGTIHHLVQQVITGFESLTGYVEEEEEAARLTSIDHLILTLATLINFAECSDSARSHVLTSNNEGANPLDTLLRLFVDGHVGAADADSLEKSQSNVAFGYLSVLLGNLCLHREVQGQISARLPGGTLRALSDAVAEFLLYHKKVDDQLRAAAAAESLTKTAITTAAAAADPAATQDGLSEKLEAMVKRLNRVQ